MRDILISGAIRTPIGSLGGGFADLSAIELGKTAARAALMRAGVEPQAVDETIFGNVLQAGLGQNPARQIALGVGAPETVPGFTVNKVCASGMKAIELGCQTIQLGHADVVLAGGIENMSQAPYLLPALRQGARLGDATAIDSLVADGLSDVFNAYHMGLTAENVAEQFALTRHEQDMFAIESQEKCAKAIGEGLFHDEIVPVAVPSRKGSTTIDADEHPRPGCTMEDLAKLRTVFRKDGTVTPGNASGINDGAAAVVVAAADSPEARHFEPSRTVRFGGSATAGCSPATMGLGPIYAVRKLLAQRKLQTCDIDLWELNEAFAAQALAVLRELQLTGENVNVNGGAIALGHPIGATGARIIVTLIHEMARRGARRGIAALCIGGGMGMAVLLEER
ncbi:MAG: acetyl-CoA C-acetyltransferase [Lentisphaerae bacterium]|jgi:acetyl-CoA C-acetyltransferase|nr:acetyl-CoA C-acetyltransferase [Lentisphaerota bacterium]MBT4815783.1 acetyl-CoA C-acetyltransferase [Lentisphaerota bacterium]MBT5611828.1 acetyl-CoA C-acetyltransferase [Lentisphaerota bacterium]MBT7059285.1 acetyl-CoA C-acetyltransferase [Lentisphaerota bacterium]MBT7843808.1 acetyl-CoA C-acetyltransferase [Lentisphaerota bacterium]